MATAGFPSFSPWAVPGSSPPAGPPAASDSPPHCHGVPPPKKWGNNKKKAFIFCVSLSSILSELMRVWDFDLPLECFVIHPGEGPCWERPKLGPAWGFGCKAFKRMGGHQHQQPGEQAYIYQLTARGQKSCTRRGQWSSTTHTNTTTNTTYNANLPSNHHSSTKDYRHVYVNDDYCLMKQHLIQYFLWY